MIDRESADRDSAGRTPSVTCVFDLPEGHIEKREVARSEAERRIHDERAGMERFELTMSVPRARRFAPRSQRFQFALRAN